MQNACRNDKEIKWRSHKPWRWTRPLRLFRWTWRRAPAPWLLLHLWVLAWWETNRGEEKWITKIDAMWGSAHLKQGETSLRFISFSPISWSMRFPFLALVIILLNISELVLSEQKGTNLLSTRSVLFPTRTMSTSVPALSVFTSSIHVDVCRNDCLSVLFQNFCKCSHKSFLVQ